VRCRSRGKAVSKNFATKVKKSSLLAALETWKTGPKLEPEKTSGVKKLRLSEVDHGGKENGHGQKRKVIISASGNRRADTRTGSRVKGGGSRTSP